MNTCLPFGTANAGSSAFLSILLAGVFFLVGSQSLSAPDYSQIVGNWDSNYGPVHLDFVSVENPPGSATLSGHWIEPPDNHKGEIKAGHYNASTGELALAYLETWSKHQGEAVLRLDESGKTFNGTFKSDDGTTGTWTWKRK